MKRILVCSVALCAVISGVLMSSQPASARLGAPGVYMIDPVTSGIDRCDTVCAKKSRHEKLIFASW